MPAKAVRGSTPGTIDRLTPETEAAGLTPASGPSVGTAAYADPSKSKGGQVAGLPPLAGRPPSSKRRRRQPPPPPPPPPPEDPPDPFSKRVQNIVDDDAAASAAVLRGRGGVADEFDDLLVDDGTVLPFGSTQRDPAIIVKDTSWCNPHFLVATLILLPSLYFIALFGVYITTSDSMRPLSSLPGNAATLSQLTSVAVNALLDEQQAAVALAAQLQFDSSRFIFDTQDFVSFRGPYLAAQQVTSDALRAAIRFSGQDRYTSFLQYVDVSFADAVDLSSLERARTKVLLGGSWTETMSLYDAALQNLLLFQAAIALHNVDGAGLSGYMQIFAAGQQAGSDLLQIFTSYQNATSKVPGSVLNTLNSSVQYDLLWQTEAMIEGYEVFARFGTSGSNGIETVGQAPYRTTQSALNNVIVPSTTASMANMLMEEAFGASPYLLWNDTVGLAYISQMRGVTAALTAADSAFYAGIPSAIQPQRLVAELACLVLLFVLAMVAIFWHLQSSTQYYRSLDVHEQSNRDATMFHRSLSRMSKFVLMAASLDVERMGAVFRRVAKTKCVIPHEEAQLYQALGSLREAEPFITTTVVCPPAEVPQAALSKHKLFVRPALVHVRGAVVLRVSLAPYHAAFASAGVKQKALQHQMGRFLTLVQDTADNLFGPRGTVMSVFGDYAALWCNVTKKVDYPVMMASELALSVLANANSQSIASIGAERPLMSICCGDALLGHIFNVPPGGFDDELDAGGVATGAAVSSSSRFRNLPPFGCFSAFGPVTKEISLMTSISKLHDVDLSMNHWAVEAYRYESATIDTSNITAMSPALPIGVAATPARAASPVGPVGDSPPQSARRTHPSPSLPAGVLERLRAMRIRFVPLDLVRATIVEDETASFLRNTAREQLGSSTSQRYMRAIDGQSELLPCYEARRSESAESTRGQQLASEWDSFFMSFVNFVSMPTTANGDSTLQLLETFLSRYPECASTMQRTADRLRKAVGVGRVTGTVPITPSQIKRARLAANLLVAAN